MITSPKQLPEEQNQSLSSLSPIPGIDLARAYVVLISAFTQERNRQQIDLERDIERIAEGKAKDDGEEIQKTPRTGSPANHGD